MNETVFLVAFFKFDNRGPEWGFKRIDLEVIFKTEQEALRNISFCDEAGWYEGALIEERMLGYHDTVFRGKRIWLIQNSEGVLQPIHEPRTFKNVTHLIG